MAKTVISVDIKKPPTEQPSPLHNRWHPDIPPVVTVKPGDDFIVEALDWTAGRSRTTTTPPTSATATYRPVIIWSGRSKSPALSLVTFWWSTFSISGPFEGNEWGYTGIFSTQNGGGFLTDIFPEPRKAIWDCKGIYATSRHIPRVRFAAITHPGLIGAAPSHELLAKMEQAGSGADRDQSQPGAAFCTCRRHPKACCSEA